MNNTVGSKKGVLLINLGTPSKPSFFAVGRYLRQFLSDPRVINIPSLLRFILVNFVILPFYTHKSLEAYRSIWVNEDKNFDNDDANKKPHGSPLLINSEAIASTLQEKLGDQYKIVLGMRYGKPSIEYGLKQLKNCHQLMIIPLFPQYASATTGSAITEVFKQLSKKWNIPSLTIINNFYQHPGFISTYTELIQSTMANHEIDRILFSYHGLPSSHIKKSGCQIRCSDQQKCPDIDHKNSDCYRAQCYETSRQIAEQLGLSGKQYIVCFQSRFGKQPWIQPYTDNVIQSLAERGDKNIMIICAAFMTDCLETLEEIGIRAKRDWQKLGGKELLIVPCLNDYPSWIKVLEEMIRKYD